MRILETKELAQAAGAFSCELNPSPVNWAIVGGAAVVGAYGGGPTGAILAGGWAYLGESWICG